MYRVRGPSKHCAKKQPDTISHMCEHVYMEYLEQISSI